MKLTLILAYICLIYIYLFIYLETEHNKDYSSLRFLKAVNLFEINNWKTWESLDLYNCSSTILFINIYYWANLGFVFHVAKQQLHQNQVVTWRVGDVDCDVIAINHAQQRHRDVTARSPANKDSLYDVTVEFFPHARLENLCCLIE